MRSIWIAVLLTLAAVLGCHRGPVQQGIVLQYKKPTAYYYEFIKDGRYYVFASNLKATAFMTKGDLPCMTALINAGPGGKTLYVEADKVETEPARRLAQVFRERHPEGSVE
jgi:hypothetical protein